METTEKQIVLRKEYQDKALTVTLTDGESIIIEVAGSLDVSEVEGVIKDATALMIEEISKKIEAQRAISRIIRWFLLAGAFLLFLLYAESGK